MKKRLKTHYVAHRFTRPMRITFMLFLFVAFFVITPAVILYTAGYRYDWITHTVRQTGVLSVNVIPRDVRVTLNDTVIPKAVPIRLTNRAPGTYLLTIERQGYKTWSRDITIESKNTTYIKDIILLKEALPVRILDDVEDIISAHGSEYTDTILILKKNEDIYELYSFNIQTREQSLIYRTQSNIRPIVKVAPHTTIAYSRVTGTAQDTLYLIPLTNPENTTILSITPDTITRWNNKSTTEPLYLIENNTISTISPTRSKNIIATVTSTAWYRDDRGGIWTADEQKITNPHNDTVYLVPDQIHTIVHANNERIIATHQDKTIVIRTPSSEEYTVHYVNGTNTYHYRTTGEWWVWSDWELSSIYPDGGVTLLNRSGERIKNITLLDPNSVILLATEKEISAFNPGYYVRHTLVEPHSYMLVSAHVSKRTLYFLGNFAGRDGLYALEY